jgi:hypothetical protein
LEAPQVGRFGKKNYNERYGAFSWVTDFKVKKANDSKIVS